jgi:hypothetical protein
MGTRSPGGRSTETFKEGDQIEIRIASLREFEITATTGGVATEAGSDA